MKKSVLLLLTCLISFSSCSDDDKTKAPELKKLTKVTCYHNDDTSPLYQVEIFYKEGGSISYMQTLDKEKYHFFYVGDKLTVSNSDPDKVEYTLKKDLITQKKTYTSNPAYVSEELTYEYERNRLVSVNQLIRWPNESGSGYESVAYPDYNIYTWNGGNITRFIGDKKNMNYEYTSTIRPYNLPLSITETFSPVNFEIVSPLNFLKGYLVTYLPSRVYWYNIPNTDDMQAEYIFTYATSSENSKDSYLTTMGIQERIYEEGNEKETLYNLHFEYN